ncbi:hypothetical protein POTOM_061970 [Populus tomentosa]|uniref:Uncharacterized protein n=1 Tax=Populus tomentosa TaxID=118781 RepID=A0A8X8BV51_POPTO|nr:hypothetical protein POTOM_061970 [Populus tomentosa]
MIHHPSIPLYGCIVSSYAFGCHLKFKPTAFWQKLDSEGTHCHDCRALQDRLDLAKTSVQGTHCHDCRALQDRLDLAKTSSKVGFRPLVMNHFPTKSTTLKFLTRMAGSVTEFRHQTFEYLRASQEKEQNLPGIHLQSPEEQQEMDVYRYHSPFDNHSCDLLSLALATLELEGLMEDLMTCYSFWLSCFTFGG